MAQTRTSIGLSAISVEGGLINPDKLLEIAATTPDEKAARSYECPKGVSLRDEIARYFRIGQAEWQAYDRLDNKTQSATERFVKALLEVAFGFSGLTGLKRHFHEGHSYPVHLEHKDGRVPVVVSPPDVTDTQKDSFKIARSDLGDCPEGRISKRRPDAALQEWLNAWDPALWGLVFVGDRLRLMRDNVSFTRPAYIEADLGAIFRDEIFSDFTALWLIIHATRFGKKDAPVTDCALERWREDGVKLGTAARDRLRGNVEKALLALGNGFLEANADLREKLETGKLSDQAWFEELLRIIYRLIFLAVSEDRDLIHDPKSTQSARQLYKAGYSFESLRERSTRRQSRDPHLDAYEAFKVTMDCLERGEAKLGLCALGGLFDRHLTPNLGQAKIANRYFMDAVFQLSFVMEDKRRIKINWRDMATEELGSVYEGLLELVPMREDGGCRFTFAGADEAKGNVRKTSGSYYTPDSLVQTLLDSALDPVLENAAALGEKAILDLNIIDPACGSGHFLLGAARRVATKLAKLRDNENPDFQHALRDVVRNCIHGVDRNPMAVELAKVALWIEAVEPGMPLGFLDANIRCGDSLLGVFDLDVLREGIPDAAYKPLTGDDKTGCKYYLQKNRNEKKGQGELGLFGGQSDLPPPPPLKKMALSVRDMPEDTTRQIRAKAKAYDAMVKSETLWDWRLACDIYMAAFLLPKAEGVPDNPKTSVIPTTGDLWAQISATSNPYSELIATCQDASMNAHTFHWPLEFPDIMATGGFAVVLGNPPWERIKLQDKEFFASRDQSIVSAANKAARDRLIAKLQDDNVNLYLEYLESKRLADACGAFIRVEEKQGGRNPLSGRGDVNTYSVFVELAKNLKLEGGSVGLIVPTGIATDSTTSILFSNLIDKDLVRALYDFVNSEPIFPNVHRSYRFCIIILSEEESQSEYGFYFRNVSELTDQNRIFTLSREEISKINPNSKSLPIFRTKFEAELTNKVFSATKILVHDGVHNHWGAYYIRLVHYGDHAKELVEYGHPSYDDCLPVYESKYIESFDHRYASYDLQERAPLLVKNSEKSLDKSINTKYRVSKEFFANLMAKYQYDRDWFIAYRDVTHGSNKRTLIAAAIPKLPTSVNLPVLGFDSNFNGKLLLSNLNSIVLDFIARQSISGSHMTFGILKQLPIFPPQFYDQTKQKFICERVIKLIQNDQNMTNFSEICSIIEIWDDVLRAKLISELDAFYAAAYKLTREELRYILDPAELMGDDYPSETFRVLKNREIKEHGEYRTQRLVLEAWDRFTADGTFRDLGLMS